jgi:hypothetical protein
LNESSETSEHLKKSNLSSLLLCAWFAVLYFAHLGSDWWIIKISNIRMPDFVDLRYVITGHSLCRTDSSATSFWEFMFIIDCGDYVYGRVLAGFSWVLSQIIDLMPHLDLIAISLGLTLVISIALSFSEAFGKSVLSVAGLSLLAFSPPILLLLERANIDIILALLVIIASFGLSRGRWPLAILALFISAVLKFYTLPLLWFLLFVLESKWARIWALGAAVTSTFIVVQDVLRVSSGVPDGGYVQFGFPVLVHYFERFGIQDSLGIFEFTGLVVPLVIAAVVTKSRMFLQLEFGFNSETKASFLDILGTLSGIVFIACFFAGLSFDYRLVFLLIAGVAYIRLVKMPKFLEVTLWTLLAIALWGSTALGLEVAIAAGGNWVLIIGLSQALGDLATMVWAGIFLGSASKSFSSWASSLRLAWHSKR